MAPKATPKSCKNCNRPIPPSVIVNGKRRKLHPRSYCLDCSPWGTRNNRKLELIRDDGLKTCKACGLDIEAALFSGTNGTCNPCYAKRATERRTESKRQCVEYLGGACQRCGYSRCIAALVFHHRDPNEKDFEIGSGRKPFDQLKGELDKCELLCSNCHAEHHFTNP